MAKTVIGSRLCLFMVNLVPNERKREIEISRVIENISFSVTSLVYILVYAHKYTALCTFDGKVSLKDLPPVAKVGAKTDAGVGDREFSPGEC